VQLSIADPLQVLHEKWQSMINKGIITTALLSIVIEKL
jgi:hypothetical protein